jgi:hypothetical protein
VPASYISSDLGPQAAGVKSIFVGFKDHLEMEWPFDKTPPVRKAYIEADWVSGDARRKALSAEAAARAYAFMEGQGGRVDAALSLPYA